MKYELAFTDAYSRKAARFIHKHPHLRGSYVKALELLELNPSHPTLHAQPHKGVLAGLHSISINRSCHTRIEFWVQDKSLIPIDVGPRPKCAQP